MTKCFGSSYRWWQFGM